MTVVWLLVTRLALGCPNPAEVALAVYQADTSSTELLDNAVQALLSQGQVGEAEALAVRHLSDAAEDPDRWFVLGRALAVDGEPDVAWGEALALDPDHVEANAAMASWLLAHDAPAEALRLAERALQSDPRHATAWRTRLLAMEATLPAPKVRSIAEEARALEIDDPLPWTIDPDHWDEALARYGEDADVRGLLALAKLDQHDFEGARALVDPGDWRGRLAAEGLACIDAGTLGSQGGGWSALRRNGLGLLRRPGDDLDEVVLRYEGCHLGWALRASQRRIAGDLDGAAASLERALELPNAPPRLWATMGLIRLEQGQLPEAIAALTTAAARTPDDVDLHLALAHALLQSGQPEPALTVLDAIHARHPTHPGLPVERALVLERLGRPLVAVRVLRRALNRRPRDGDVLDALTRIATAAELDPTPWIEAARAPLERPVASIEVNRDPEVDEVIEVLGEGQAERLRRALIGKLEEMGYDRKRYRNGKVVLKSSKPITPFVVLHDDGRLQVQKEGMVNMPNGEIRYISPRKMRPRRAKVIEATHAMRQQLLQAMADPAWEAWLEGTLPQQLDALWAEGQPLSGQGERIEDPAERRAQLLRYWAQRTCSPQGDAVREAVARFVRLEVQESEHPASDAELADAEARGECGATLR